MVEFHTAYKKFLYKVPFRHKLANVVRYFFKISFLEKLLISKLLKSKNEWYKKLIPPHFFYNPGSIRRAQREEFTFRLDISMFLDHAIFFSMMNGDPAQQNLLRYLQPHFTVLDVGANIGYLTLQFARSCHGGFVYSFEPDSQNFEALQTNVNLNDFQNIRIFKKALGSKPGTEILYKYYPGNPGTNRILKTKPDFQHQSETIDVITVDQFIEEKKVASVELIKIDVEGFEKFVLEGSAQTIEKWWPILFVELVEYNLNQQGYSCLELIEYIERLGYEVKDAVNMGPVDKLKQNHNTDIVCFPIKK